MRGIRVLVLLGVCAVVALWWGGQNTYVALRDRHQLEISCSDYLKKRPDTRWLKLTDCTYDFDNLAYFQKQGEDKYTSVYLPLRPVGETGGPTHIAVKFEDREFLDVVWGLEHGQSTPPGFKHVTERLLEPTQGLVAFGLAMSTHDREELERLGLGLADDFVIIDNDSKPNLTAALIVLCLGLGLAGALAWFTLASLRERKAALAQARQPRPPMNRPPMGPNGPASPIAPFERQV